ncbi:MAG TPA: LytTR family DNA-binding domain-containing protein [Bacteroidia bacterium]|jgi:DNA-binding LytR/AlgR family response regulator|nr:LytTR family DNA-binding domain-containing protein [Bacteroidia bacterium]
MIRKLKCAIVDNDPFIPSLVKDLVANVSFVEISNTFNCPLQFLKSLNSLNIDVCLLDINMPGMDGLTVSEHLNGIPYIFITGNDNLLRGALDKNPVDIITKPISPGRLLWVLEKTYKQVKGNSTIDNYALFNVAESTDKVKIKLNEIQYVESSTKNPRNKVIILRSGKKYTLMDNTFEKLLSLCPELAQVNRKELISLEAIRQVRHDEITIAIKKVDIKVTLSDTCRKKFMARLQKH